MSKKVCIINLTRERVLLEEAEVAGTFFRRLKGLLGRGSLPEGKGILIAPAGRYAGNVFSYRCGLCGRETICFLPNPAAFHLPGCPRRATLSRPRRVLAADLRGDLLKVVGL